MILPEGKNKKYISVISGLYILYVILNPILNIDKNFAISDIKGAIAGISNGNYVSQEDIAKTYILEIENDLKAKIEEMGYGVDYVQFSITPDYKEIRKIEVKMKFGTNFDENKIEKLILDNFEMEKANISISWKGGDRLLEKIKNIFKEKDEKKKIDNLIAFLIILVVTLIIINKILKNDNGSK